MKTLSRQELYELVRDATDVGGAQRLLLDALAWRANPRENYTCFPSYQRLAKDTHCTEQALRVAAKKLEDSKLIQREKRRNRSNRFYLNVPRLLELNEARKASERAATESETATKVRDPFQTAQLVLPPGPADQAVAPLCEGIDDALTIVRRIWPDHPSHSQNEVLLIGDLEECMQIAGSWQRCAELLYFVQREDAGATEQVGQSRMLGRYLVRMFPIWLPQYEDRLEALPEKTEDAAYDL